jgi:hypothetical protein
MVRAKSPRLPGPADPAPRPGPGRPRLTPEALQERIAAYCKEYGVAVSSEGLPPFPSGQRETAQHRQWMALYKAHRRGSDRAPRAPEELARIERALTLQHGRCAICRMRIERPDARLDEPDAALHTRCLEFLTLARALGPDALDQARARL